MQSVKKFLLMTIFGAALAIVPAQADSGTKVLVDIPFDFALGNTTLKAGSYEVQELQSRMVAFCSDDGQQHEFALTVPDESANRNHRPELVFVRYGNETFLHKVFLSGNDEGLELPRSRREKRLIQKEELGRELSLLIPTLR